MTKTFTSGILMQVPRYINAIFIKLYFLFMKLFHSYFKQESERNFLFYILFYFSVTTSRNLSVVEAQKAQLEL